VITRDDLLAVRSTEDVDIAVRSWARDALPARWRKAAETGGPSAVRNVRDPGEYRDWYPTFAAAGLVVPQWRPEYGPPNRSLPSTTFHG
jgi:alkylation response protein AidB-like acyl-CoA dehydrogenase